MGKLGYGNGIGAGMKLPRFPGEGTDGAGRVGIGVGIETPGILDGTDGTVPACMAHAVRDDRVEGWKLVRNKVGLPERSLEPVTVLIGVHFPVSETT
jgi:hypothetical protein